MRVKHTRPAKYKYRARKTILIRQCKLAVKPLFKAQDRDLQPNEMKASIANRVEEAARPIKTPSRL